MVITGEYWSLFSGELKRRGPKVRGNGISKSSSKFSKDNLSVYLCKAGKIRKDITDLKDILIAKRKDYITALGHHPDFVSFSNGMNDWDRDVMDSETDQIIQQCTQMIQLLRRQIKSDETLRASDELLHLQQATSF
ncbi:unnamed protein product [Dracunculus medinensis]|uniref:Syntaxin-6_N domain-containing protein n=1 Tax=Dracunculus medinensis TaxID=318479 RepID=A0A0N4U0S5_DRAME|nr:unnamed protein product [Dracunculus medinensis]